MRTTRLWLDRPVSGDLADLHAFHADPATWTHFPSGRHTTLATSEAMLSAGTAQWAERGLGYWSVRDRAGGPVIGRGGCAVPGDLPWWNLYYRFAVAAQGHGYAEETARVAIATAREVEPARPVLAYLVEHNIGSRRTAEKVGMRLVWRGPDHGNPDPGAIRLVYLDREPSAAFMDDVVRECAPPGAS